MDANATYLDYQDEERNVDFEKQSEPMGMPISDASDEIIKEIRTNIRKAKDHLNNWFEDSRQAYDYYAGNQWEAEDIAKLREERRPAVVFNRIPRTINAIVGIELDNRQEAIYTPRQNKDGMVSEVLTGAAQYVRDNCDAEDEESQAIKDALITGLGWIETRLDYETDPDGAILIERVDPMEMVYDVSAKKRNLSDAAWVAREKTYSKKDFHSIWPDVDVDTLPYQEHNKGLQPHDAQLAPWYKIDQSANDDRPRDKVTVIQYQKWVRKTFYRIQKNDNSIVEMDEKEFKQMKTAIDRMGYKYIKQTRKVYKQWFIAGSEVLEEGDCPVNEFTFRAITGMLNRNVNTWFGMVHLMRDPQMWANKWLSQALHIFNSNAKGGWFAEENAFKNPRQAERTIATSETTYLNEDGITKIMKKEVPAFPAQINELLSYAVAATSELVGVNLESLGQVNREQAGVLEVERKRTTITILADFFDAVRRYRKEQARVLADFIKTYISDGRLVRIAGPGVGEYVPLVKEQLNFKYDIVIDDMPSSPNQRERVFSTLVTLLPSLMQAGIPIPPEILEYAPLPASLIQSWQKLINEPKENKMEQMKEQIRIQLAELEKAKMQQDLSNRKADELETKSKVALNFSKIQHERAMAEFDQAKALRDESRKDIEFGLKAIQGIM